MRLWIPATVVLLIVVAYLFFYAISAAESEGASSLGIANTVGLIGVFVAVVAAGLLFRRATPHR